jgi:hypothetical protein
MEPNKPCQNKEDKKRANRLKSLNHILHLFALQAHLLEK